MSQKTIKRSIEEYGLICRRILIGGGVPVVPEVWLFGYRSDPRLRKSHEWWVNNVYKAYMHGCPILCYKPNVAGITKADADFEKSLWRELNKDGIEVASDVVLDFLLNFNAKRLLQNG